MVHPDEMGCDDFYDDTSDWRVPGPSDFDRGAAVAFGVVGMFEAIRSNLWSCDHCHRPDDPKACCRGQNFVPADPNGPWICWVCGVDENYVMTDEELLARDPMWAVPSPSGGSNG